MLNSEQKNIVLRYADMVTQGQFDALHEIMEPNFEFKNSEGAEVQGIEKIKLAWSAVRECFDPETFRWEILEMFEEGNVVTATWIIHVKHVGAFLGYTPSHKAAEYQGMSLYRFSENGKLSEFYGYPGTLKVLADLGLFHLPGHS